LRLCRARVRACQLGRCRAGGVARGHAPFQAGPGSLGRLVVAGPFPFLAISKFSS
jgi:hypothetical protein